MLTVGSLCSGYGGLDMAVCDVLDARVAWHAELDPAASKILAHHWPGVPNLGDIKMIDWSELVSCHAAEEVMPSDSHAVDVLTAGYP